MNFKPLASNPNLVDGFCIVKTAEVKPSKNGSKYLDVILADKDGEINGKMWDYKESDDNCFKNNDFVKVRGSISTFNDQPQFRIDRIRKVNAADEVNIEDYVPSACLSGPVMLNEILMITETFQDSELKHLVKAVLAEYREKLLYWPAAKSLHHSLRGGLLMHTLTIIRLCSAVKKIYTFVNFDLLCAGAILHDVMKIEEIDSSETGIAGEYTVRGNLLGHLVMGAMEIDRIGREIGVSEETLTLVEHMLISHHGAPEFGAAKPPMFIEAEILSELDNFDARMYVINSTVKDTETGSFSNKIWSLDNRMLYNHGRADKGDIDLMNED